MTKEFFVVTSQQKHISAISRIENLSYQKRLERPSPTKRNFKSLFWKEGERQFQQGINPARAKFPHRL
jgi:hypothetical protein